MKIAICLPCYGDPKYRFVLSLLDLQRAALSVGGFQVDVVSARNALVDHAREYIADKALKGGAEYLLWLDADMTFPATALERLITHDLPVVAANYRKRNVKRKISSAHVRDGGGYRPIKPRVDGLEEVDLVGFGVCLMKAEVFADLPRPWFVTLGLGEDAFFFQRLNKAKGIRPVVDHRFSADVGHITDAALVF